MAEAPVYYFARIVPGYRIPILERLNERLGGRLVVCSGRPPRGSSFNYLLSGRETAFRRVTLKNWWLRGEKIHAQAFRRAFRTFGDPSVVLAEESPRSLTLPLLLLYAHRTGAGRVLWGHFSSLNRTFDPNRHVQDRYRLMLARQVEACACYTSGVAEQLKPYVAADKLFVARNTIDLQPMFDRYDMLVEEGKQAVRRRLGIDEDSDVLVYLGRLVAEKGTTILINMFGRLAGDRPAVLLIIGDGPERESMQTSASSFSAADIRFLGPLSDEEAAPYLFASDVMVMPGYLGLVINHAFAYGLPVVSMRNPVGIAAHSPEVEYVRSGENGMLCSGSTPDDLYDGVRKVLEELPRYSANAVAYARDHLTTDRMVDGLHAAVLYAQRHRGS